MYKRFFFATPVLFALALGCHAQYSKSVDPLLGVDGGGNTFPGAVVPYGMVKAGPDMGDNSGNAGWMAQGDINGFSQTHVTGTGGGAKYGNIMVQPTVGEMLPSDSSSPGANEAAAAGYYRVGLSRYQINVEITASRRAALYRFTYPTGKWGKRNLLFDVSHCLSSYANQGEDQSTTSSEVHVMSASEVSGSTSVTGGWNLQKKPYTVYFYAQTDTPAASFGTWTNGASIPGSKEASGGQGDKAGAWLTFSESPRSQVHLKVGISFISVAQAKRNAISEIKDFDFAQALERSEALWDAALSPIELHGVTKEQKQVFYTALYHAMLMPTDRTGENPGWQSDEPYYDDYYAIWDTFRTSGPLLTLIAPEQQTQIARSLVDIYRHEGWLPDARSGNSTGRTQGGSNADFVLAEAYLKSLQGIDWETAYAAMKNDAEATPPDQIKEGRGDVDEWKTLGYVTMEGVDRPASKQMDYAADDFAVAQVAKGLGKTADYEKYLKRSGQWENLWDTAATDSGYTGFIWSRHRDGSWKAAFDGLEGCSWGGDTFYEGNSWTYSTYVPHDEARVVAMAGGPEVFVKRMDAFFEVPKRYDVGNEPGFLAPYLYLWAGRPDKTASHLREIIAASFHGGPRGLPGNDDSGAMSSWFAFGQLGFYPNAGQDVYVFGSPAYPETTMHLGNGKTLMIVAKNVSEANKYITNIDWNGTPYTKTWFRHADLLKGGKIVLTMSATPNDWGKDSRPPSVSDKQDGPGMVAKK